MGIRAAVRSGRPVAIVLATLAILVGQDALADDNKSPQPVGDAPTDSSLDIVIGVNWLNLPSWDSRRTDFFGGSEGSRLTDNGLGVGYSLDIPLGEIGSQPLVLEWNGGIADLSSSSNSRTSLAGQNTFDMSFGNRANGSIALTASAIGVLPAAATALVTVNDSAGGTATIASSASSPAGGQVTQFASSTTITGGAFTALVTNGDTPSAAAYAAYGDNTGFTFSALGDLSNSAVIDSRSEDTTVIDQTLLLGAPIDLSDGWSVTPKFGPTYRSIDRDVDFTRTIDIGESISGVNVPTLGFAQNDQLDARYVGAIGGLTITKWVQPDLRVSLDARLGGAYLHSKYRSQFSAMLPNAANGSFDALEQTRNGAALLAGLNAGVRYAVKENVEIGFNTGVDFTSKVPTVKYVNDAGVVSPTIDMSHALGYNASVNVTWHF
ncbi:hypothetical protein [Rhizobium sp. Root1220]|uniref:hypothetical protein n=1 Tax=Rhizobium sp. Root1220 TaxID=1736432 RepID=UPI0006FA1FF3|nr:hypothetical protein [Rhizobium sp. Root1220]KQV65339.1 hypothetical protein ASC90_15840 [Rhizobium sp. Root1220]